MKGFFLLLIFWVTLPLSFSLAAPSPVVTQVAILSGESKADFEAKIEPILKEQLKACAGCSFKNITPYDTEGKFDLGEVPARLEDAGAWASFVFFNWNASSTKETKPVVEALKKLVASGKLVLASAGSAKDSEPTLPIARTIAGEVPGMVIVGDMGPSERLPVASYFGPEMLTAVKAPSKEHVGQGYGPVFFASRLATNWTKKNSADWAPHFQETKSKVRRIWPALEDFFGRGKK